MQLSFLAPGSKSVCKGIILFLNLNNVFKTLFIYLTLLFFLVNLISSFFLFPILFLTFFTRHLHIIYINCRGPFYWLFALLQPFFGLCFACFVMLHYPLFVDFFSHFSVYCCRCVCGRLGFRFSAVVVQWCNKESIFLLVAADDEIK